MNDRTYIKAAIFKGEYEEFLSTLIGEEPQRIENNEIILWRSVVARAILDGLQEVDKIDIIRPNAIKWFSLSNKDFLLVCEMAELDAGLIISHVHAAFKTRNLYMKKQKLIRLFKERKKMEKTFWIRSANKDNAIRIRCNG